MVHFSAHIAQLPWNASEFYIFSFIWEGWRTNYSSWEQDQSEEVGWIYNKLALTLCHKYIQRNSLYISVNWILYTGWFFICQLCNVSALITSQLKQTFMSQPAPLALFDMSNLNRFDILSISIFCKIALSISISISIFFKSVDISTIDMSYRYIEQG